MADISNNHLQEVDIGNNHLQEVDISNNHLQEVDISNNHLQEVDISNNYLQEVDVSNNHLQEVDISNNHLQEVVLIPTQITWPTRMIHTCLWQINPNIFSSIIFLVSCQGQGGQLFNGAQLLDWLLQNATASHVHSRRAACALAQRIVENALVLVLGEEDDVM